MTQPSNEHPRHAYLQQLARAHRFRDRYERYITHTSLEPDDTFNDLEDFMYAAFQHCWAVKDWLRNDLSIPDAARDPAVAAAESTRALLVVADLANGSKHYLLTRVRAGASDVSIELDRLPDRRVTRHHIIAADDGSRTRAIVVLDRALDAWNQILRENGLFHYANAVSA